MNVFYWAPNFFQFTFLIILIYANLCYFLKKVAYNSNTLVLTVKKRSDSFCSCFSNMYFIQCSFK